MLARCSGALRSSRPCPTALQLLLTATCFPGIDGYKIHYATEYQILLFDASGKEIKLENGGRLSIPALRPTLLA